MTDNIFDPVFFGDNVQFDIKQDVSRTINETVVINDSVSRQIALQRIIFEPEPAKFDSVIFGDSDQFDIEQPLPVSVSDNVTRELSLFRSITEPSVTTNDTVERLLVVFRNMSESVTSNDMVNRNLQLFRSISNTVVISDTVSRMTNLFRNMSESVTLNDSVDRMLSLMRAINETAVSVSDTVTRTILSPIKIVFVTRIRDIISFVTRVKPSEDLS